MKKLLTVIFLLAAIPLIVNASFCASAYEPVGAQATVVIKQGGKAIIIPEVNCPIPDKTELELEDGEEGRFNIQFTEPGVYAYTVKTVPDSRKLNFDSTVYTVKVYVTDENGKLSAVTLIYANGVKYAGDPGSSSPGTILFVNMNPGHEETTSPGVIPIPVVPTPVPGGRTPATPEKTTAPGGITPPAPVTTTKPDRRNRPDAPERTTSPRGRSDQTEPEETTAPVGDDTPAPPDKSNPKTSDDTGMEVYFLIAMIASAGLLVLSIIYAADCRKLINSKKSKEEKDS